MYISLVTEDDSVKKVFKTEANVFEFFPREKLLKSCQDSKMFFSLRFLVLVVIFSWGKITIFVIVRNTIKVLGSVKIAAPA
jgi:hypothetical protein